jgi:uncharacterized membrane protein
MIELLAETALKHVGLAVVLTVMATWTWNIVREARGRQRRAAILRRLSEFR